MLSLKLRNHHGVLNYTYYIYAILSSKKFTISHSYCMEKKLQCLASPGDGYYMIWIHELNGRMTINQGCESLKKKGIFGQLTREKKIE